MLLNSMIAATAGLVLAGFFANKVLSMLSSDIIHLSEYKKI